MKSKLCIKDSVLRNSYVYDREPDPECIPPKEAGVPHHANPQSALAKTNHIIIYDRST